MTQPRVSIIIPARNEANHIKACLEALIGQRDAPRLEIIVVDNNSTDATGSIVQSVAAQHPDLSLRLIHETTPGRGAARAAGFAQAQGEVLLSTDADTIVPSHWVQTLAYQLDDPAIVAVSGGCRIRNCSPLTNALYNYAQPITMGLYRFLAGHWLLTGANFGILRTAYDQVGGFNPACHDQEDVELSKRVAKVGRIRRLPGHLIFVSTDGDRFRGGIIKGFWQYIKGYIGRFWLGGGNRFTMHD